MDIGFVAGARERLAGRRAAGIGLAGVLWSPPFRLWRFKHRGFREHDEDRSPSLNTPSPAASMSPEVASPSATATLGHGRFSATGSMAVARNGQTAVLLQDGDVLIAGGSGDDTAELYDPKTGTFGQTGPMNVVRTLGATATLLPDGRVLLAGGSDNSIDQNPLASAELYDPATGKFSPTGSMAQCTVRSHGDATSGRARPRGGRVRQLGGDLASAELYDPATGKFSPTGAMVRPRSDHTATLLADGRVLIVGGTENLGVQKAKAALASAELYDPRTGKFVTTGSMSTGRSAGQTATLLADGLVLVAGGNASYVQEEPLASAELYDPRTGTFHKTGSMAEARDSHTATLLPDGRVLVAGGDDTTAELYDPEVGVFAIDGIDDVDARLSLCHSAGRRPCPHGRGRERSADGARAEVYQP